MKYRFEYQECRILSLPQDDPRRYSYSDTRSVTFSAKSDSTAIEKSKIYMRDTLGRRVALWRLGKRQKKIIDDFV